MRNFTPYITHCVVYVNKNYNTSKNDNGAVWVFVMELLYITVIWPLRLL